MTNTLISFNTMLENARHNRASEQISRFEAESGRMTAQANVRNAQSNARNADTNAFNARINAQNAATNARNADTNARNADTNARNADTNWTNALTNIRNAATAEKNAATARFQAHTQSRLADSQISLNLYSEELTHAKAVEQQYQTEILNKEGTSYGRTMNYHGPYRERLLDMQIGGDLSSVSDADVNRYGSIYNAADSILGAFSGAVKGQKYYYGPHTIKYYN